MKVNKEIKSTINSENTKPLNEKVNDVEYLDFNQFKLLHIIPDVEKIGYESLLGDIISSIRYHKCPALKILEYIKTCPSSDHDNLTYPEIIFF
ncbi:MAG: hypothetical protein K0S93_1580 [Nitrososphaeraceae archaeon]|nr:hypothetical protein [Nitrososphaeraceae archaeon]